VWLDAHGDLNTPETSPSGNLWGMPLRIAIDEGSVDVLEPADVPSFMPVPGGPSTGEVLSLLQRVAESMRVAGMGVTGLGQADEPERVARFAAAAGL
jgi:arginase family enzyme